MLLVYLSGHWRFNGHEVGANALRVANHKVNLGFEEAIALGILCNGLVCLAVWLCYSARSNTDKAVSVLFPITAFVAAGFEHSIANMFFVPLGLLLKEDDISGRATVRVDVRLPWTTSPSSTSLPTISCP